MTPTEQTDGREASQLKDELEQIEKRRQRLDTREALIQCRIDELEG